MKTFDETWEELFKGTPVAFIKSREGKTIPIRAANKWACEYFWHAALRNDPGKAERDAVFNLLNDTLKERTVERDNALAEARLLRDQLEKKS